MSDPLDVEIVRWIIAKLAHAVFRFSFLAGRLSEKLQRSAIALNINSQRLRFARWKRERALGKRYYHPGRDPRPSNLTKEERPRAFTNRGDGNDLERLREAATRREEKRLRRARRSSSTDTPSES